MYQRYVLSRALSCSFQQHLVVGSPQSPSFIVRKYESLCLNVNLITLQLALRITFTIILRTMRVFSFFKLMRLKVLYKWYAQHYLSVSIVLVYIPSPPSRKTCIPTLVALRTNHHYRLWTQHLDTSLYQFTYCYAYFGMFLFAD